MDMMEGDWIMRIQIAHIGINIDNENELKKAVSFFHDVLGMETHERENCIFMNTCIELMKGKGPGEKGHIAFAVDNIEETIHILEKEGTVFAYENFKYDEKGRISAAYFKDEAAGFAVHLIPGK